MIPVNFDAIPQYLREQPRWTVWYIPEWVPGAKKPDKKLCLPNGEFCPEGYPITRNTGTFDQVRETCSKNKNFYPGFWMKPEDGLIFLDYDGESNNIPPIPQVPTYCDRSVYGFGYHCIGWYKGEKPTMPDTTEVYLGGHWIIMTGSVVDGRGDVNDLTDFLAKHNGDGAGRGREGGPYRAPERIANGERNNRLHELACSLSNKNLNESSVLAAVRQENIQKCTPPLPDAEVVTLVKSAHRFVQEHPPKNLTMNNGKLMVNASKTTHSLTEHTDLCISAITKIYNAPHKRVFVRGGMASGISYDEKGNVVIRELKDDNIRCVLDKCCNFVTYKEISEKDGGGFETIKARPPKDISENILATLDLSERFPPLRGLVEAPYITSKGVVITKPGYCDETGLYFAAGENYKEVSVPESPTTEQVAEAAKHIDGLFADFLFEDDASRDNVFGALLTSVLRPAINGCTPMYLVDKPQMGVGGSLICEIINRIAVGKPLQPSNAPKGNDAGEWEKRIISILASGIPSICFDNIESNFHSSSLASVITAEKYSGRVLGSTNNTSFDVRVNWFGNGINLNIQGDMPRRIYLSRITTDMPRPQLRIGFKIPNIKEHVLDHRFEYIRDILTIARAYYSAGCPKPEWKDELMKTKSIPQMGGFEGWRDFIGGMMVFVGKKNFLGNMENFLQDCESQGDDSEVLLTAIYGAKKGAEFTAKDVITDPTLSDSLPAFITNDLSASAKAKKLGWFFRSIKGKVFPRGYRIKVSRTTRHTQKWTIDCIEQLAQTNL